MDIVFLSTKILSYHMSVQNMLEERRKQMFYLTMHSKLYERDVAQR